MKIYNYSDFNDDQLNENFWQDVKYGLSKLGRYKAGGKILGRKETDDKSREEIKEIMKKESNKLLKKVHGEVLTVAPEFPNDRRKVTFLRGVIMYGQLYDSLVAATKGDPRDEGYMAPDVANAIIEDLRKVVKKFLDVDLKAVYSVMESNQDLLSDMEISALYEEEEILKKLAQLKDKAMDKLFGAKKGSDAEVKSTRGQSSKFQQTSGETNVQSDRMKTLQSNKLPIVLAGVGAALGAIGWIAQTQWFKDLITTTIENPAQFGEETFTETVEKNIKVDGRGWSYTIQNNGYMDATGKSLNFNQPVENLKDAFEFYGGGDQTKGIEAMSNFLGGEGRASSVADITKQLADPSNKTVGDIFNKLEGTWGDKVLMNQNGGAKSFIAKQVYTQTKKVLIKTGFTTTTTSVIGGKLVALSPILMGVGIALIGAGAVVKLLREKGQRQSRAKTLNDLLQSLQLVPVSKKSESEVTGEVSGEASGEVSVESSGEKLTEKTIYPTMIKNLTALRGILLNASGVKLEGESEKAISVGKIYNYTNKEGKKSKVKVISLTHNTKIGKDSRWLTKDDENVDKLQGGFVSVLFPDGDGEYTKRSREMAVKKDQLDTIKESRIIRISEILLERDRVGKSSNVQVNKDETYLTQAVINIRKSLKSLEDDGDKGIGVGEKFISDILDKKMDSSTKEPLKNLYSDIYSYLYGRNKSTLGEFGPLYKESVDIITNKSKRQVVAEKIARFAKRSFQFEGEGFYGGLGKFGDYIEEFNKTLGQIMDYQKSKSEETKEGKILSFGNHLRS